MSRPKPRSEDTDNPKYRTSQDVSEAGERIIARLGPRNRNWLARQTDLPASTISDAIRRGPSRTDVAAKIAAALDISLDWLIRGGPPPKGVGPADIADVDWVAVPTYDLATMSEAGKGEPTKETPIRRDWLNSELRTSTGLWLTTMPCDYQPLELREGDRVFCRDIQVAELRERQLCIWRELVTGRLLVGRFGIAWPESIHIDDRGEYWINRLPLDDRGGPPSLAPVAHILGRPIAEIR